ncbi:hypothetical protein M0805_009040 [Coniferiporia weirii]|nr:hypothetical protein M0805_009040 [Coniferiporia weirii]
MIFSSVRRTLEFLNIVSSSARNSHFRRIENFFIEASTIWKSYTLTTMLTRFAMMLTTVEAVMFISSEPELAMHESQYSWRDIIKEAIAHDIEECSEILLDIVKHEDITQLRPSVRTAVADAAYFASEYCDRSRRSFDRFMREIAERLGVLPSIIIIHGIRRLGDGPLHGGGFGDVWKGELNGSFFALKSVRVFSEIDVRKLERDFGKEAILWHRLKHPNVLAFLGISRDAIPPRVALVSRWMDNGSLASFSRDATNVDGKKMVKGVASGLRYLHGLHPSIVHGDLRAANILVDESLEPRITDFGLARIVDSQVSIIATSFRGAGVVRWQAPELLDFGDTKDRGESVYISTMSDVYAFACVCLEVFTGEVPFPELSDFAIVPQVLTHKRIPSKPNSAIALERGLDEVYWDLMQTCWKFSPSERPSMMSVAEQLGIGESNRSEETLKAEEEKAEEEKEPGKEELGTEEIEEKELEPERGPEGSEPEAEQPQGKGPETMTEE